MEVFINPDGDKKTFYHLILNMQNSVSASLCRLDGSSAVTVSDVVGGIYTSVTTIPKGVRAALSVPLKTLKNFDWKKARFNFCRNRILTVKKHCVRLYTWSPFVKRFNDLENFGKFGELPDENSSNEVDNGDFSVPQRGRWAGKWFHEVKLADKQSVQRDTSEYFSYPACMKMVNNSSKSLHFCQYLPKLEPGCEYEFSCMLKYKDVTLNPQSNSGGVSVNINVEKNTWFPRNAMRGTRNWSQLKFRFKTTAKSNHPHRCYIRFYILGATGSLWVDDVMIRKVSSLNGAGESAKS